jgi:hypothetical protein
MWQRQSSMYGIKFNHIKPKVGFEVIHIVRLDNMGKADRGKSSFASFCLQLLLQNQEPNRCR